MVKILLKGGLSQCNFWAWEYKVNMVNKSESPGTGTLTVVSLLEVYHMYMVMKMFDWLKNVGIFVCCQYDQVVTGRGGGGGAVV